MQLLGPRELQQEQKELVRKAQQIYKWLSTMYKVKTLQALEAQRMQALEVQRMQALEVQRMQALEHGPLFLLDMVQTLEVVVGE